MMIATVFSIFKLIAVVIILAAMAMVILGIGHISKIDDIADPHASHHLMRELLEDEKVIGEKSEFYKFLFRTNFIKQQFTSRRGNK